MPNYQLPVFLDQQTKQTSHEAGLKPPNETIQQNHKSLLIFKNKDVYGNLNQFLRIRKIRKYLV